MKNRELRNLVSRAAAAIDDPAALTKEEKSHLVDDLYALHEELEDPDVTTPITQALQPVVR